MIQHLNAKTNIMFTLQKRKELLVWSQIVDLSMPRPKKGWPKGHDKRTLDCLGPKTWWPKAYKK